MNMHYYMLLLVLSEPSLDFLHRPDEVLPPYSVQDGQHLDHCRKHAMDLLGCTLTYDDQALREVPIFIYVQIMLSAVVLIKFNVSAAPSLNIIIRLLQKLKHAAQDGKFLLPRIFSHILQRLLDWHHPGGLDNRRRPIRPLLRLDEGQQISGSRNLQGCPTNSNTQVDTSHAPLGVAQGYHDDFSVWEADMTSIIYPFGGAGFYDFIEPGHMYATVNASDKPSEYRGGQ